MKRFAESTKITLSLKVCRPRTQLNFGKAGDRTLPLQNAAPKGEDIKGK